MGSALYARAVFILTAIYLKRQFETRLLKQLTKFTNSKLYKLTKNYKFSQKDYA